MRPPSASILCLPLFSLLLLSCLGSVPRIGTIDPRIGNMGEVLVLRGSNFGDERGEGYVSIAGIVPTSSSYIEWKSNRISVRIPDFGDSGLVYVHQGNRKSNAALFTNRASMPMPMLGGEEGNGPRILSIEPASAKIGTAITITGRNFGASRESGGVFFAWDAETPPSAPATARGPFSTEVSTVEFGYELWSDRELRIRIPDGAISGNVEVRSARGSSMPVFFDIAERPGTKTYKEKRSYAISYSVDIQAMRTNGPNALYIWMPKPIVSAYQRNLQLLSRNPEPFVEEHRGASLFQFKDIAQGTKAGVSVSYLVDVYAVETAIKPQAIKKDSASAVRAAYVQGNQYIPSDNPDILKMSAKIVGREKNPYVQANLVYDWMVAQGGIETGPLPFGAIESLAAKKSDAYSATLLFCALARSLDIPAQPVSGFLIDRSRKAYRHFWAEFWIDGFGWVPVDPAAGAGALPEGFGNRPDNRQFYFGNLDNQRVAFSRGISVVSQMDPRGRIVARDREYALQTLWEEATGGLESYSSLWSDLVVTGIY